MSIPKTKMISIRLSPDEFRRLQQACGEKGIHSVSEFTRTAVKAIIGPAAEELTPAEQLAELQNRVHQITAELERLSHQIGNGKAAATVSGD